MKKSAKAGLAMLILAALIIGGLFLRDHLPSRKKEELPSPVKTAAPSRFRMNKTALRPMVADLPILNALGNRFEVKRQGQPVTLHTSLDTRIQTALTGTLDRLKTLDRGKPQRIAMVAMDGSTGFIKAMAGFDLDDPKANPCTAADYPAASIIKIVTAAAAVDTLGYSATTPIYFNGNKYTLYKRQLTEKKNKYTTRVSLASAFADSINPVFGKLGKLYLGRDKLEAYARGFGFNQGPVTDFPTDAGAFSATEDGFHLAELGCGFNRDTQISPVFAATMVSAVVNGGKSLTPRLVDQVTLPSGELIYKSQKEVYKTPIKPETAFTMMKIMKKTVSRGTARKSFRRIGRDKVLSHLVIGGKTGSLFNRERTVKYDWFAGFGRDKKTGQTLVVSVVVGHRKYIGTRAATHARNMLKTYFSPEPKQKTM